MTAQPRRSLPLLAALISLLTVGGLHAEETYASPDGLFTIAIPPDWTVAAEAVGGYPALNGPKQEGSPLPPSITFVKMPKNTDLAAFAQEAVATSKQFFPTYKLVSQEPFETASGLHGIRQISQSVTLGQDTLTSTYLFEVDKSQALSIIAMQPAKDANPDRFDALAKSLVLKK